MNRRGRTFCDFIFWNKRGEILVENVVFIILNLLFLLILILFLLKQGSGAVVVEQSYAKNIALLIDLSKPGMLIRLNVDDAIEIAEDKGVEVNEIVQIEGNLVKVKLSPQGGYAYSFFNDVLVTNYFDKKEEVMVFVVNEK